jgi:hypothetical protein
MTEIVFDGKIGGALRENKGKDKKARRESRFFIANFWEERAEILQRCV